MALVEVLVKLGVDISEVEKKLRKVEEQFEGFTKIGDRISKVGQSMTVGLTVPIAGVAVAASKMAMNFNTAMADVATLIPGNIDRVEELKKTVQDMAVETGKRTADLSRGLYQVVSAFGDSADTAKILETNARAAAAGLATTEEAIALTSAVTKGYGDASAAAVAKTSDLALLTVRLGQTTFPELAGSIGRVTPLAAALGVETEELFAVMATLTGVTGGAAEVSTQFRAVLQALMKPTEDMALAISEVARNLDAQGKLAGGPLVDSWRKATEALQAGRAQLSKLKAEGADTSAIKAQEKATKDLADAVNSAAAALGPAIMESAGLETTLSMLTGTANGNNDELGKMFGSVEALTAVLALSGGQSETFSQRLQDMGEASGATDEAFKAQTEGINATGFAWQQMTSQLEVTAQKIGDVLAPALSGLLAAIMPLVEWFGSLDAGTQRTIVTIALMVAAIGPIVMAIGFVISSVSNMVAALVILKKALAVTKVFFLGTATKVGFLTKAMGVLKAAFVIMTGPIGIVIAIVAALAAAAYLLVRHWDIVTTFFTSLWESVKSAFANAWDAIESLFLRYTPLGLVIYHWETIGPFFQNLWAAVVEVFNRAWQTISAAATTVWQDISGFLSSTWEGIRASAATLWNGVAEFFAGLWERIRDTAIGAWTGLSDWLVGLWGGIRASAADIWERIRSAVSTPIMAVTSWLATTWETTRQVLATVWAGISTTAVNSWMTLRTRAGELWEGIRQAVVTPIERVRDWLANAWQTIRTTAENAFGALRDRVLGIWDNLVAGISKAVQAIISPINAIVNAVQGALAWIGRLTGASSAATAATGTTPRPAAPLAPLPPVPHLAAGGIVRSPTLAMIGEGRHSEAVVPLKPGMNFGGDSAEAIGAAVYKAMRDAIRVSRIEQGRESERQEISIELDGAKLGRALVPLLRREGQRTGVVVT